MRDKLWRLTPIERRLIIIGLIGFFFLLGLVLENGMERNTGEKTNYSPPEKSPFPIDINSATEELLEKIPGIGKAKASDIVEYRNKLGGFKTWDDLLMVPGIGEKTLEKMKKYIKPLQKIEDEKHQTNDTNKAINAESKMKGSRKLVNINTASKRELMELPGIGEVKAQRIIEYRPFKNPRDLLKVPGIGEKTLEKIKDLITF